MRTFPLCAALIVCVLCGCKQKPAHGVVMQKVYTPASWGSGVAFGKRSTPVVTHTPETFTILIHNDDGTVSSRDVTGDTYAKWSEGQRWDEND